jgi:hypothetical protein
MFPGGKGGRCVGLTTLASTSWNPQCLSRLVMGLLYLFTTVISSLTKQFSAAVPTGRPVRKFPVRIANTAMSISGQGVCGFLQCIRVNSGAVPRLWPWPLPSISIPFHQSWTILSRALYTWNTDNVFQQTKTSIISRTRSNGADKQNIFSIPI